MGEGDRQSLQGSQPQFPTRRLEAGPCAQTGLCPCPVSPATHSPVRLLALSSPSPRKSLRWAHLGSREAAPLSAGQGGGQRDTGTDPG